jgi:hypothetical protein
MSYVLPAGEGKSISEDSALVRSFRNVLKEGKPMGRIAFLFYEENGHYFTLGSLSYTGKHMIFFPGVKDRRLTCSPEGRNILNEGSVQHIDYLTLEENLQNWHVKFLEGQRYRRMNTKQLSDTMFLWFVMVVQDAGKLEIMPRTQEMHLKWDNLNDLQRRMRFIDSARGDVYSQ